MTDGDRLVCALLLSPVVVLSIALVVGPGCGGSVNAYDYPGEVSYRNCNWDASKGPIVYRRALPCDLSGARVKIYEPPLDAQPRHGECVHGFAMVSVC